MAFSLSPAVTVKEFDKTLIVPGVATSIASAVGHFQWGPIDEITLVDSEEKLVSLFGGPDDDHYADWFPVANFLAYSNNLKLIRAAKNVVATYADLTFTQTGGTVATAAGDFTENFAAGDNLVITGTSSNDNVYVIDTVVAGLITVVGDFGADEGTADAPGTFATGAFNAMTQTIAVPTDGTELTEAGSMGLQPSFIKNADDLADNVTAIASTAFYARCPGEYGNKLTVSAFNGARNEQTTPAQTPAGDNWDKWAYKNFFDYAPTGTEIHIAVILDGNVVETFLADQDSTAMSNQGGTTYFVEMINRTSQYIFCPTPATSVGVSHQTDGAGAAAAFTGTLLAGYEIVPVDFEQTMEQGANGAPALADYQFGWDNFKDPETEDINFALQAGGGTAVGAYILQNVCETRLDAIAVMSPDETDVVNAPAPEATIAALRASGGVFAHSSSYGVIDGNYKKQYDKYNDTYRWIAFNGDIAGLMAFTDDIRDPWWSPAGLNRGNIKNVYKVAFNPTKAQRDELYKVGINPIVQQRGEGTILFGDKTAQTKPSAFDRINVRRLFITLEKAISTAARYQLFEFNDAITRNDFLNLVEPFLRTVQGRRGLTDFRVVCDETNNTGEIIDSNQFIADIYIKPTRSINFIQLNFIAVKTGVDFEEITLPATG